MKQYIDEVQDQNGNAIIGASIEVDIYPGTTKAALYSDDGITPIANPVTSDSTGQFMFFVAQGIYTLKFTYSSILYKTQSPVQIFDEAPQMPTSTGSENAQVITNTQGQIASLAAGDNQWFIAGFTNTSSAVTLAVDGTAATHIRLNNSGPFCPVGTIIAGNVYQLVYDGSHWILINPSRSVGSFTMTLTGMSASTFGTVNYAVGPDAFTTYLYIVSTITGTSNATTMTGTGIPTLLYSVTTKSLNFFVVENNTTQIQGNLSIIAASGTWTFGVGFATGGFTASGTKGIPGGGSEYSYTLD